MNLTYNYFSPLNFVFRHTKDLKPTLHCRSGKVKNKQSTPKHFVQKRASSANKNPDSSSFKKAFQKEAADEPVELLTGVEIKNFQGFDEVVHKRLDISKKSEFEELLMSRRNSIKDEIKTIFEEDFIKNSCMVQTGEMIQSEKPQPSLLNYIPKSRPASRVQVTHDLSLSMSIKKYIKAEKIKKSTRFFLCQENKPRKVNQSIDSPHKIRNLTPNRMKVRIEKKVNSGQVCKIQNLADTCSLFNEKIALSPISALLKISPCQKAIRMNANTCKNCIPIKFNFLS